MRIPRPIWARLLAARLFERSDEVRRIRAHLEGRTGTDSVVEAGCGFGFNARCCRGPYLGLDSDPGVIAAARRMHPRAGFRCQDGTSSGPAGETFHTALLCLVLHEVASRRELLEAHAARASHRVLVYDYDQGLGLPSRLRLAFWEPPSLRTYWGFDLEGAMARLGWSLAETWLLEPGTFRCWEFQKAR